jgi:hypothetical protein
MSSCTDLGCPHNRAEHQDGEALVRFGAILDDVHVHEHDKDGDRDNEGKWSKLTQPSKTLKSTIMYSMSPDRTPWYAWP